MESKTVPTTYEELKKQTCEWCAKGIPRYASMRGLKFFHGMMTPPRLCTAPTPEAAYEALAAKYNALVAPPAAPAEPKRRDRDDRTPGRWGESALAAAQQLQAAVLHGRPEEEGKMPIDRIEEIAARVEAATPGPWVAHIEPDEDSCLGQMVYQIKCPPESILPLIDLNNYNRADEELEGTTVFIAHARTDIPYLLEQVRTLSAQVEAMSLQLEHDRSLVADCVTAANKAIDGRHWKDEA